MSKIQCFLIEKLDKPLQWKKRNESRDLILCEEDDPEREIGSPWYRRLDTGEEMCGTQPGAMFYYEDVFDPPYTFSNNTEDGKHLVVVLPDGHWWHVDSTPSNGGRWTRSGTPPIITATPSILTYKPVWEMDGETWKVVSNEESYHGFLTNGFLESC